MDNTLLLNVSFNISDPLRTDILTSSQQIREKYGANWWIDDERYYLHLSVFLLACPEHNRSKIADVAERFYTSLRRLKIEIVDVFASDHGLMMLEFKLTPALYSYHNKSLNAFNPLRENVQREKYADPVYLAALPEKEREMVEKYGHKYVLDLYHPHVSLTKIDDPAFIAPVVQELKGQFIGRKAQLDRVQVHEAIFGEGDDDRMVMLYSKKIK